ncbi:DNA polymerase III subunit beta [Mycoplasma sp. 3341]|uniref:DNA polymerase III subunit beta n=1 Tax=Mycoplasma sp. 3341 TaxID=3447506 RepID=UPI003F657BA2
MYIKISKTQLDKALERAAKIYDGNTYLASLKGILIEAIDSKVTFIVSSEQLAIKHTILSTGKEIEHYDMETCQVIEAGKILVPLILFRNIVKNLDGIIELKKSGQNLLVKTENDKFEISLMDPFEYPEMDFRQIGNNVSLNIEDLKSIYKNVAFATDFNNVTNQIVLNMINIEAKNGALIATATNSFRLAKMSIPFDKDVEFSFLILPKNLRDILNFEIKGEVDFNVDESKISLTYDGTIIQSSISRLQYKDTSKVIPKTFDSVLVIDKKNLSSLLTKAKLLNSEKNNKIRLTIANGVLSVSSQTSEVGKAEIKTTDFKYGEEKLDILVINRYLTDAINVFEGQLNILFAQNNQRIVVTSQENKNIVQLLTPQKGHSS